MGTLNGMHPLNFHWILICLPFHLKKNGNVNWSVLFGGSKFPHQESKSEREKIMVFPRFCGDRGDAL
jgi:hypothetical protein